MKKQSPVNNEEVTYGIRFFGVPRVEETTYAHVFIQAMSLPFNQSERVAPVCIERIDLDRPDRDLTFEELGCVAWALLSFEVSFLLN